MQVRKTSQAALLVLLEQGLVEKGEDKYCTFTFVSSVCSLQFDQILTCVLVYKCVIVEDVSIISHGDP